MRLWESPLPRKLRTYDLRHTHGTLLRKAGVDIGAVSMGLGHSSPEITARIYDHSGVQDFREQFDRALSFGYGQAVHADAMQAGVEQKEKAPGVVAFASDSEGFESGRQDLNLRPLGPESSAGGSHGVVTIPVSRQASAIPRGRKRRGSHLVATGGPDSNVLFTIPSQYPALSSDFMTIREVAERLRVCRATVYRMIDDGRLPVVRVSSGVIRIRSSSVARVLA